MSAKDTPDGKGPSLKKIQADLLAAQQRREQQESAKLKAAVWTVVQFASMGGAVAGAIAAARTETWQYLLICAPTVILAWVAWWQRSVQGAAAEVYEHFVKEGSAEGKTPGAGSTDRRDSAAADRLAQLNEMLRKGLITKEECERKRKEILDKL